MKVLKYTVVGFVDRRQLTMQNIEETRQQMIAEGRKFPTNEQLNFDTSSDWWLLLNDVTVNVLVEKQKRRHWLSFCFKRGFCWDGASCPKAIRSIADDSAQEVLIAAMVHDILFTCHYLPFREANAVFYGVMRLSGASWVKARIYWLGVASPVGRIMYNKKTIHRAFWQAWACDFTIQADVA